MDSTSSSERQIVGRRGGRLPELRNRLWFGSAPSRVIICGALLLSALLSGACGDDSPVSPTAPTPPPTSQVGQPGQPAVTPGDGMLTVSWTAVPGAASYTVQWKSGAEQYAETRQQSVTPPSATITRLTNGATYTVRVRASNAQGDSDWSPEATGTPQAQMPPPARPGQPAVTPGDGMLTVSWTAVPGAASYTVQWKSGSEQYAEARQQSVTTPSATLTRLTNGATYTVRVRASNAQGDSDWSPEATGTPQAQMPPPARPGQPAVTSGDGMLTVSWTAVPGAASYTVQWKSGSEQYAEARQQSVTTPSATLTRLTNGATYTVRVRASNAQGDSDWSPEATGTPQAQMPPPARPGQPAVTPGDGMLTVSWTAVPGAASYTVQWKSGAEQYAETRQQSVTPPSATITRLTNGATYTVRVRASNAQGDSDWSPEATGTPQAQMPPPARPGQPAVTPGDGMLTVSWTAVPGAASYTVQWKSGAEQYAEARQQSVTPPSATITRLTNGATYTVRVRASNAQGDSDWSPEATGTPQAQMPPPARPGQPAVTPGDGMLTVSWTTVPGAASYTVQWKSGAEQYAEARQQSVTPPSATITGLTNGATYTVRVRASNAQGDSDWSPEATGTPQAQMPPPARPGQPAVTPGDGMLTVSWTTVPGAASYTVQWKSGAEQYAETRQQSVTPPSATITRLTNGATYTVRVRASNAQGDSDWSPEATGTHAGADAAPGAARATGRDARGRHAHGVLDDGAGRRQLHRAVEVRGGAVRRNPAAERHAALRHDHPADQRRHLHGAGPGEQRAGRQRLVSGSDRDARRRRCRPRRGPGNRP